LIESELLDIGLQKLVGSGIIGVGIAELSVKLVNSIYMKREDG
jgi:hypothetical protein